MQENTSVHAARTSADATAIGGINQEYAIANERREQPYQSAELRFWRGSVNSASGRIGLGSCQAGLDKPADVPG